MPTSETAVCLSTVGIADRSDRVTFDVRGAAADVDAALAALGLLGEHAWWARAASQSAVVRCQALDRTLCASALGAADVSTEIDERFAAIEVIGPRAADLVHAVGGEGAAIVLRPAACSYELLVEAAAGPEVWGRLLDAGAALAVACVGLEALEHLAASHRLSRPASPAVP